MSFSSYKKDHINYVDPTIFAFLFLLLGSSFTISSSQNVWNFFSPVSAIFSSSTKTAELTQLYTQDFSVAIPCSVNHLLSTSFYWILQTSHKFGQCWLILKNWPVYFSQSETKQYLEWMILNEIYCYLSKWLWSYEIKKKRNVSPSSFFVGFKSEPIIVCFFVITHILQQNTLVIRLQVPKLPVFHLDT